MGLFDMFAGFFPPPPPPRQHIMGATTRTPKTIAKKPASAFRPRGMGGSMPQKEIATKPPHVRGIQRTKQIARKPEGLMGAAPVGLFERPEFDWLRETGDRRAAYDLNQSMPSTSLPTPGAAAPLQRSIPNLDKVIKQKEGDVPFVYKDSKGFATYGIGTRDFGMDKHDEWKRADSFLTRPERRKMGVAGKTPNAFKDGLPISAPSGYMMDYEIKRDKAIAKSVSQFPDFWSYPKEIQLAIVDMYYNMGDLVNRKLPFTRFAQAVRGRDWGDAAKEIKDSKYYREDVPSRAEENRQRFLKYSVKNIYSKEYL